MTRSLSNSTGRRPARALSAVLLCAATLALPAVASAAPVITAVGTNYASSPFSFTYGGNIFTLSGTGDFAAPTAVRTGGNARFNTIFGSPTTNFVDRGTVTFGSGDQYGAFATATPIRFSNGNNFIGLSATIGSDIFYGFAFTTNNVLNSYGFENVAGRAITATAAIPAVPEPATWMMMIGGFTLVGAAVRRSRHTRRFAVAAAA